MTDTPKTVAELREPFAENYMGADAHKALDDLCRRAEANERLREAARQVAWACTWDDLGDSWIVTHDDIKALRQALAAAPSQEPKADEIEAQRQSWARGEAGMGSDADEARYRHLLAERDKARAAHAAETEDRRRQVGALQLQVDDLTTRNAELVKGWERACKDRDEWKAEAKKAEAELAELRAKLEASDSVAIAAQKEAVRLQRALAAARADQRAVAVEELKKLDARMLTDWSSSIERKKLFDVTTTSREYWQGCADAVQTWIGHLRVDIAALTAPAAEPDRPPYDGGCGGIGSDCAEPAKPEPVPDEDMIDGRLSAEAMADGGIVPFEPEPVPAQPPKEPDDELARAMVKLDESACGSSESAQLIAIRNVLRILARKAGAS